MTTIAPKRIRKPERPPKRRGEQLSLLVRRPEPRKALPPAKLEPARAPAPEAAPPPQPGSPKPARRATAESMAARQREISVSEFFTKNRHLLGFDSPAKALLTTVKEAVDNSLDACEEAGILPEIAVEIVELCENRHRVIVQDNGPGILKPQVPKVFGKLLYGSKFHRLRQSRGQQGIGISAAAMYGQLTTGKPIAITSRTRPGHPAHHFEIVIDTSKNAPVVVKDEAMEWAPDHGTRIEIELEGTYKGGRRSVDEYLELVGIANPHATIAYRPPKGREPVRYERVTQDLPREPDEIKPHPYGVELGALGQIMKETSSRTVAGALGAEFCRVSPKVADEICAKASVRAAARPRALLPADLERLHRAIPQVKIFAPPGGCVVPIGEDLMRRGLEREIKADFYATCTRPPAVYRGNPFVVEAGLAFGGELREGGAPGEEEDDAGPASESPIRLLRLANRAPLQHQQGACAITKAVIEQNWRQYGLTQPRGALPLGPMVLTVHIASVWVPYTSESKEAVAHYDEIVKEIKLALREAGRKLLSFVRHREHEAHEARRRSLFELYIPEVAQALESLTGAGKDRTAALLQKLAARYTGEEGAP